MTTESRPFATLKRECVLTIKEVMLHLLTEPHGICVVEENGKKVRKKVKRQRVVFAGHEVCINSLRLACFKVHGVVCAKCGVVGQFFAVEIHNGAPEGQRHHINLYAVKDGEEVLMTQDHVIPKSKGGANTTENSQTMCSYCNKEKGAIYPGSDSAD